MQEERIDVLEKMQELYQKFGKYLKRPKTGPNDTDVAVKSMSFNVGKQEKVYTVNMELDFALSPRAEEKKEEAKETA